MPGSTAVPRLIVIKGVDEGKQFELTTSAMGIGRDRSNPICLHDTEVSRRHAEIHPIDGGEFRVLDVGSANGTFVNNLLQRDKVLQSGDHLQIGQTILVYSTGRPGAQAASSDLADRISMITRQDVELSSAIVKTIGEAEGSRILAKPDQAGTPWLRNALANLGIMYETIQAVSHILDLDQLLERIMELIFKSIEADRGCIMLRNEDSGQLEPKAVRWRQAVDQQEKIAISRTIMEHVLKEKQGVLVTDASQDERFNTGQSIVRFGIREVICVPMKGRHETLGVLYLDTHSNARDLIQRSQTSRFSADHLSLAIAIAHQAALALEETRYHQAMVQAERLAAIGQTIAALSHHIKNVLQGLRHGRDILKMGIEEKDEKLLVQGWKMVEKGQAKIQDLVMDMLSYSKEREPAIENTNLNHLAQEVVDLMKGRAKELNAKLEARFDTTLPLVPCDPEGMNRALLNIVGNAIDAVEDRPDARVVVTTELEKDEAWVRLSVLDNGVGIPAHKVAEVFRPFVSTKGSRGTGLGLAVSRKILREHGGDILVQSTQGRGTKMVLRLPMKSPFSPDSAGTTGERPLPKPPPERPME
jgi:signal transduction histidine kinase